METCRDREYIQAWALGKYYCGGAGVRTHSAEQYGGETGFIVCMITSWDSGVLVHEIHPRALISTV